MLGSKLSHSLEVNLTACRAHIKQELFCESTILDIGKDLLHSLLGLSGNDLRTSYVIAILSSVGDGVSHSCEARLVDQVNDQLHLVDTLKVSISRIVASLNQGLKASLHQSAYAAAKNSLLTEEVSLSLGTEGGLQKTCSCAADSKAVCQSFLQSLTGIILLYSYQTRSTLALLVLGTNSVARCLRSDHGNIYVCRRFDAAEMNVEAVSEHQHVALFQVRLDIFLVHISLQLIVDQDHDDICFFCSLCCGIYFKALCLSLCPGLAALVQTDDDVTSGLL